MKRIFAAAGVGMAFILAAALLLSGESGRQGRTPERESHPDAEPTVDTINSAQSGLIRGDSADSSSAETVYRVPGTPDQMARATDSQAGSSEVDRITTAVAKEDAKAAVNLLVVLHACRSTPATSEQMDNRVRAIEEARENPDVTPESIQALEDQILSESPLAGRCYELQNARENLFNSLLREEAEAGNQVARFLYSMWAPNDALSTVIGGALLVEYEANALRFTLENLAERSPLGLMAVGISYVEGEYFTPKRESLGSAYLMAAQLCGIDHPLVDGLLQTSTMSRQAMKLFKPVATNEQMNEAAIRLHAENCDIGVSGLTP